MRRYILPRNIVSQSGIIQSGQNNHNVQLTVMQNAAARRFNANIQKDIYQSGIGNMNFQSNILGQSMTDLPFLSNIRTLPSVPLLSNVQMPNNVPFISSIMP